MDHPMQEYFYERPLVSEILTGLGRKKRLLHIITGPRQVGKTTAALQIAAKTKNVSLFELL
jgi:predicted AAA+ superfamily ATPase